MYSLLPAAVAALFLGYGLYVLRRAGVQRVSLSFFLLCFTTFAWQFTWAVLFQVEDQDMANLLVRVGYLFILFLPTSLYHFLVEMTARHEERRWVGVSYGLAILLALLLPSDRFVAGHYEYFFGFYPRSGLLHPLHVAQTVVVVLRGLYITWRAQQVAPPRLRIRFRYCVTSVLIYLFAAADYLGNYGFEFYPPGVFFISVSLGLLAIAAVKHQLMDVSMALTQGIARALTLVAFALAWTAAFLLLTLFVPERHNHIDLGLGLAFLVLVGEGYVPLWRFLQGLPMRLGSGNTQQGRTNVFQAVSDALGGAISLADLMRNLEQTLVRHSRLRSFQLLVRDDFVEHAVRLPKGAYGLWNARQGVANYQEGISVSHPLVQHFASGETVVHCGELPPHGRTFLRKWEARSAIAVRLDNDVVGILLIGVQEGVEHYASHDLDVIEFLPGQLSLAFDRVRAHARLNHSLNRAQKSASLMALMNEYQHELKAPISIMHMYAQSSVDAALLREEVRTQCDRVLRLLERMLRVMQDNRVREERPVDVNALIRTALRLFPPCGPMIETRLGSSLPRLVGDGDDLLIVLLNLLKNAYEATDSERENRIFLATRYLSRARVIQVEIGDRGTGMSPDRLNELWLPSPSNKKGGTGIGLKVVQRVVAEHGGKIHVDSAPGQGTLFRIELPLAARSEAREAHHE